MAYLRREKETVEMDFPLNKVWQVVQKTIESLGWKVEETDEVAHRVKAKTKNAFMSYSSTLLIEVLAFNEGTTRVRVSAETPVTTITSVMDFGRTKERIDSFLVALGMQLTPEKSSSEGGK